MTLIAAALVVLGLVAPVQTPQEQEALKRDLLREVEKRLKAEEERLLKDIEKVIDEELTRAGKKPSAAAPSAPPVPVPPAPPRKPRGYMGVRLAELTDEEKKDLKVDGGLRVVEVVPDGPASKAGLKPEDVIVTLDGRALDSPQVIPAILGGAGPGTAVKVEYVRGGKTQGAQLILAPHPADVQPPAPPGQPPPPKEQGKVDPKSDEDLRERIRKFMEKKEAPKAEAPKAEPKPKAKPVPAPADPDDLFAFDEDMMEQFRPLFDKLNVDPEQFFEKGQDGKYRLNDGLKEMFKNFDFEQFKGLLPKSEEGDKVLPPAPKAVPPPAPKKVDPKSASRPWLGLQAEELPEELRAQLDVEGLLVAELVADGPAARAGLRKNDVLMRIDGKPVKGEASLADFMKSAKPGQEVALTVLRKGKELALKATLGDRKE